LVLLTKQVSLLNSLNLSYHSDVNHLMMTTISYPSLMWPFGLRHSIVGSSHHSAETRSLYFGLVICFQLLPTWHHCHAVSFSYKGGYPLDKSFTC
jgi:hypothetical protein